MILTSKRLIWGNNRMHDTRFRIQDVKFPSNKRGLRGVLQIKF